MSATPPTPDSRWARGWCGRRAAYLVAAAAAAIGRTAAAAVDAAVAGGAEQNAKAVGGLGEPGASGRIAGQAVDRGRDEQRVGPPVRVAGQRERLLKPTRCGCGVALRDCAIAAEVPRYMAGVDEVSHELHLRDGVRVQGCTAQTSLAETLLADVSYARGGNRAIPETAAAIWRIHTCVS